MSKDPKYLKKNKNGSLEDIGKWNIKNLLKLLIKYLKIKKLKFEINYWN